MTAAAWLWGVVRRALCGSCASHGGVFVDCAEAKLACIETLVRSEKPSSRLRCLGSLVRSQKNLSGPCNSQKNPILRQVLVLARRQLATTLSCEVKHGVSHIFIWQIAASDSGNCACRAPRRLLPQHSPIQPFSAERRGAGACALSATPWRCFAPCASPAGHGGGRRNRGATGGSCSAVPRAPLSQKPSPSVAPRACARAALDGSLKTPTERRAAASLNSRPCAAADCRCPTRCPPRRREVDATAAPVT